MEKRATTLTKGTTKDVKFPILLLFICGQSNSGSQSGNISDVAGLGLIPKPARLKPFLGGPSLPEARSPKPKRPVGFFMPKIGQFPAEFWQNYDTFCNKFFFQFFGRKSADLRPIFGRICGLDQSLKSLGN